MIEYLITDQRIDSFELVFYSFEEKLVDYKEFIRVEEYVLMKSRTKYC